MVTKEYKEAFSEILEILKYFDKKRIEKIPKEIIDFFDENKDSDYEITIDLNKPLEKQNIKRETKDILVSLYVEYLCPEEGKEEINRILNENYIKEQNNLRQEYSSEDIFKNRYESKNEEHLELVQYNENVFTRILKKIKQLLNIK